MKGLVWTDLSTDEVEQLLAALVMETHPGAYRMEGAGGDGGIDVGRLDAAGGLVITQIKAFARPLQPGQKRQVVASAKEARKHGPVRWELLMPLDHSPPAKKWFDEVVKKEAGCECEWLGKTWIETQLAGRPHLLRLVRSVREQTLDTIAQYSAETAALAGGIPDLVGRMRALQQQGDNVDPYYRFRTTSDAQFQQIEVIARSPEAATQSPITGSFRLEVPTDVPDAQAFQEAWEEFVGYGGRLDIPSKYISAVNVDMPAGLGVNWAKDGPGSDLGVPSLHIGPDADSAEWVEPGRLTVIDAAGKPLSTARLTWCGRSAGQRGITFNASDPTGCLNLTVRLTKDTKKCTVTFNLSVPEGCTPQEPLELLNTLKLIRPPHQIEFYIGTQRLVTAGANELVCPKLEPLEQLLLALDRIASATGPFTVPAAFGPAQLLDIYWADQLLQGARVPMPLSEFSANTTILDPEAFKAQLSDEPQQLALGTEFVINLPGGPISIGRCTIYFVAVCAEPAGKLREELRDAKVGDSLDLVFKIVDGSAFMALGGPPLAADTGPTAA